jgi:hypothetical protein
MEDWKLGRLNELRRRLVATTKQKDFDDVKKALEEAVTPFVPTIDQIKEVIGREEVITDQYVLSRGLAIVDDITTICESFILETYRDLVKAGINDLIWHEECAVVIKFCEAVNAYYYARPSERFTMYEALFLCKQAGNKVLVTENLS